MNIYELNILLLFQFYKSMAMYVLEWEVLWKSYIVLGSDCLLWSWIFLELHAPSWL